jgi:hypothetical protein
MTALDRRRFLRTFATAVPAGATVAAMDACGGPGQRVPLADPTLDALAEVLLPEELGPDGVTRAVNAFRQWLADYRPAREMNHGYGTAALEYTPPHPGAGWGAQLEALELEAQQRYGTAFARLDRERRIAMARAAIARDRTGSLGDPAGAHHVAVGLLAHFYASPEAANLCYRAMIDAFRCRPLAGAAERPAPFRGS